jgi:hypothetical protein
VCEGVCLCLYVGEGGFRARLFGIGLHACMCACLEVCCFGQPRADTHPQELGVHVRWPTIHITVMSRQALRPRPQTFGTERVCVCACVCVPLCVCACVCVVCVCLCVCVCVCAYAFAGSEFQKPSRKSASKVIPRNITHTSAPTCHASLSCCVLGKRCDPKHIEQHSSILRNHTDACSVHENRHTHTPPHFHPRCSRICTLLFVLVAAFGPHIKSVLTHGGRIYEFG